MISYCSKLEIRWRRLWLKVMSMIDTSIKTYWIRIFIQYLTLYRLCSLEQQYIEKRKNIINIEFIFATYFQLFPMHLTQLFCWKGNSSILNSYPQHMLCSSSTWHNFVCQKRNIWAYRCNFLIVILLIRLHEYTKHFSVSN